MIPRQTVENPSPEIPLMNPAAEYESKIYMSVVVSTARAPGSLRVCASGRTVAFQR